LLAPRPGTAVAFSINGVVSITLWLNSFATFSKPSLSARYEKSFASS